MRIRDLVQSTALTACVLLGAPLTAQAEEAVDTVQTVELTPYTSWSDIEPFTSWGDIEPFTSWSDIEPFTSWGDIEPFTAWSDIEPFTSWGDIEAFKSWGDIEAFSDALSGFWTEMSPFWRDIAAFENTDDMTLALRNIAEQSELFWGAAVTEKTGQSFEDGFANALYEKYGIDLDDPSSLDDFGKVELSKFYFDWYDGLMSYTGLDHADWWMPMTNWRPSITQEQGGGDTIIGLIDFTITGDADLQDNVADWMMWSGNDDPYKGHGGAVASLLVADHDGKGVMGIAPQASVAAFNPFDSNGVASFESVAQGIVAVNTAGARVVNLSLGVSGSTFDQGWADLYSRADVQLVSSQTIFVHAAGNDGVMQTSDIQWDFLDQPTLVVVGSVGPNGEVSKFSNTPGNACFTGLDGDCDSYLKDHFIVAPGEHILVTDGHGGVERVSGTSFAAPIVTGAIALMQDRWSWLAEFPEETVQILFETATDLGEAGVDDVYGHGLLNIEAMQSPLDFNETYFWSEEDGELQKFKIKDLSTKKKSKSEKLNDIWHTETGYFVAFEDIGDTHRDFLIPMEEQLVGTYAEIDGRTELFQSYLHEGFTDWTNTMNGPSAYLVETRVTFSPLATGEQVDNRLPYRAEVSMTSPSTTQVRFGQGDGATRLGADRSTVAGAAHPLTGGDNPVLGLASGGGYANVDMPLAEGLRLSMGVTERRVEQEYADPMTGEATKLYDTLDSYQSNAVNIGLSQSLTERLSVSASYTSLTEDNGLLGMQSLNPSDFGQGARTNAATVGARFKASETVSMTASVTYGATANIDADAALKAGDVTTSAFELAIAARSVFRDDDALRLALVQPMHVETGALETTQFEVVDRTTGEMGLVDQSFDLSSGARRLAMEARYGTQFNDGDAEISAFARFEGQTGPNATGDMEQMFGGRVSFSF